MISKHRSLRRLMPAFGVALVASLALSAVGAASASAYHWYAGGTKIAPGVPTGFLVNGTSSFSVKWTMSGAQFQVKCSSENGEGTMENPAGGGTGTLSMSALTLGGCTVYRPEGSGCKVGNGGTVTTMPIVGKAAEFESKPAVTLSPAAGGTLFVFTLESCKNALLNHIYEIAGSINGFANGATSSLEFTKASSSLIYGGIPAWVEGTTHWETTAGQALSVWL